MQATDGCISSLSSSWRSNFDEVFIRDVLGFQINSYGSTNDVNLEGFPTIVVMSLSALMFSVACEARHISLLLS